MMSNLLPKTITAVDNLALLIDNRVNNIKISDHGWMVGFDNQEFVLIKDKIPLTTIMVATFANNELRGIPRGFNEIVDVVANKKIESLLIQNSLDNKIAVNIRCENGENKDISLQRSQKDDEQHYSMEEFFEEIGPEVQSFPTGRSLAPIPKKFFQKRISEIYELAKQGLYDELISLPPLMITIGATDICNFKCEMCFRTRKGYIPGHYIFPNDILRNLVLDMADMGMHALRFCGEGENMLHPRFLETLMLAKVVGLNTFMITNGTVLYKNCKIIARCLDYLRVSFNAMDPETYKKIHGINNPQTYFRVLQGLTLVREERDYLGARLPILSMSCVICQNSLEEALSGRLINDILPVGLDFLVMKKDRIWQMSQNEKELYGKVVGMFENQSIKVADYSGVTNPRTTQQPDWENKLGLGCAVRYMRANIDRFDVHSCVEEHEVYGVITENRFPQIWLSAKRFELQRKRMHTPLKFCANCFWGDFHRILNCLFQQEANQ